MDVEHAAIVETFRALAESFRRLAGKPSSVADGGPVLLLVEYEKQAGGLVIRAFHRGWLPKWNGLAELVERVENPPADPPEMQCKPVHNESNLFIELCGLHHIPVFNTGHGLEVTGDTCGGILPAVLPGVYKGNSLGLHGRGGEAWAAVCDQKAACCGLLARIIEAAAAAKRQPRRRGRKNRQQITRPVTPKQLEAAQIVGECDGNIAEAARKLGVDYSTMKQHHDAALSKLGKSVVKHATRALPAGRRGEANLSEEDDWRR